MNDPLTDDIGPGINAGAIKVYDNDGVEDFPILKAFQQYVEAEQTRARKRLFGICLFFSFLMLVTITVFVVLLVVSTSRNQALNDRLVEYAMNDRYREKTTVSQSAPAEIPAVLAISQKLDDLRSELSVNRQSNKSDARSDVKLANEKNDEKNAADKLEIERLKALLAIEKEKAAFEREKKRQAELEDYRRKHYPELYADNKPPSRKKSERDLERDAEEADREIEEILKDIKPNNLKDIRPISYFDEEDVVEADDSDGDGDSRAKASARHEKPKNSVNPPNNIKDENGNAWEIPLE